MTLFQERKMLLGILMVLSMKLDTADGHAKMIEPPMRSSMWRFGFDTPINYNDNELFCGGIERFKKNGGKCGTCGDPYDDPHPEHEAGGRFATGSIVRYYPEATSHIPVTIDVTAHHKGFFEFRLCSHNNIRTRVSQKCLDQNILVIEEGEQRGHPYRFFPSDNGLWNVTVRIPPGITCTQCVLQMRYKAGNSWGRDSNAADKGSCLGCGIQEEFRNCADISIGYPEPPSTTVPPVSKTTDKPKSDFNQGTEDYSNAKNVHGQWTVSGSEQKDRGVNSKSSTANYTPYTKIGKVIHEVRSDEGGKHINNYGIDTYSNIEAKDYNFRVQRIEEALSLLDDTERVLTGLDTNLAEQGTRSKKVSATQYVKLYAGLVWTRRKINHLEQLIGKIVSKLYLIANPRSNVTNKKKKHGVYLSEFVAKPSLIKDKVRIESKPNNNVRRRISQQASGRKSMIQQTSDNVHHKKTTRMGISYDTNANLNKYGNKTVTNLNFESKYTVADSKVIFSVTETPVQLKFTAENTNPIRTTINTMMNKYSTRDDSRANKKPNGVTKPTLVDKFPVLDSWASLTTQVPGSSERSKGTFVTIKPKFTRVVPPNALSTSLEASPQSVLGTPEATIGDSAHSNKGSQSYTTTNSMNANRIHKSHKNIGFKTGEPNRIQNEMLPTLGSLGLIIKGRTQENSIVAPSAMEDARNLRHVKPVKNVISKWHLAELRNRILHQEYLQAAMRRHKQNENSILSPR